MDQRSSIRKSHFIVLMRAKSTFENIQYPLGIKKVKKYYLGKYFNIMYTIYIIIYCKYIIYYYTIYNFNYKSIIQIIIYIIIIRWLISFTNRGKLKTLFLITIPKCKLAVHKTQKSLIFLNNINQEEIRTNIVYNNIKITNILLM